MCQRDLGIRDHRRRFEVNGNLAVGSAGVAAQLITMKYGRSAELESDRYGMQYMSAAGYALWTSVLRPRLLAAH